MPRQKIEIPATQVEQLAQWHCSIEEIASFFKVSRDTIERRFRDEIEKGKAASKMQLRRKQYDLAKEGNVTMLIWLGKQWLGQSDRIDMTAKGRTLVTVHELLKRRQAQKKEKAKTDGPTPSGT